MNRVERDAFVTLSKGAERQQQNSDALTGDDALSHMKRMAGG